MGLFKTQQEKDAKKEAQFRELCEKYHLDADLFDDKERELIRNISYEYMGDGWRAFGNFLHFDMDSATRQILTRQNVIIDQNWMMIRLLAEIARKEK